VDHRYLQVDLCKNLWILVPVPMGSGQVVGHVFLCRYLRGGSGFTWIRTHVHPYPTQRFFMARAYSLVGAPFWLSVTIEWFQKWQQIYGNGSATNKLHAAETTFESSKHMGFFGTVDKAKLSLCAWGSLLQVVNLYLYHNWADDILCSLLMFNFKYLLVLSSV
jgi:hypothetical protein